VRRDVLGEVLSALDFTFIFIFIFAVVIRLVRINNSQHAWWLGLELGIGIVLSPLLKLGLVDEETVAARVQRKDEPYTL